MFPVDDDKHVRFATGSNPGLMGSWRESRLGLSGGCDGNHDGIKCGNPAGDYARICNGKRAGESSRILTATVWGNLLGFQLGNKRGSLVGLQLGMIVGCKIVRGDT